MRLTEISDEEKTFLKLKQVEYEFLESYRIAHEMSLVVGKSVHRQQLLADVIDGYIDTIHIFLDEGFNEVDPDVLAAKDILNKLQEIRNRF